MDLQQVVDILNRFLAIDPEAVSKVFNNRVPLKPEACANAEADPTLIPGCVNGKDGTDGLTIGTLGIINGLFGSRLAAHYGDAGIVLHFSVNTVPATSCDHPACVAWKEAHPDIADSVAPTL